MVYATPTLGGIMTPRELAEASTELLISECTKANIGFCPVYKTANAACADLATPYDLTLAPFQVEKVPLMISLNLPEGYHAKIYPRSSLLVKHKIYSPVSVIDQDYKGIIHLVLMNLSTNTVKFNRGTRLCQIEIVPTGPRMPDWIVEETERDPSGFGTTG